MLNLRLVHKRPCLSIHNTLRIQSRQSQKLNVSFSRPPLDLPSDVPLEEEKIPGYDYKHFYPAHPDELLANRYKLVTKIGWGHTSTIWLAEDTRRYITKSAGCEFSPDFLTDGGGVLRAM